MPQGRGFSAEWEGLLEDSKDHRRVANNDSTSGDIVRRDAPSETKVPTKLELEPPAPGIRSEE